MDQLSFEKIENEINTNKKSINYYVDVRKMKYNNFNNLTTMGVYVFWYCNKNKEVDNLNRKLLISGPNKLKTNIEWDWNLNNEYICLYVGKSTNIKTRIKKHLLLKTNNLNKLNINQPNKVTSTCQLRSGFDYLYLNSNVDIKDELIKHLYLSIYYEQDFIKRFYLEDYLIGKLKPWFNVDSER